VNVQVTVPDMSQSLGMTAPYDGESWIGGFCEAEIIGIIVSTNANRYLLKII
jgi:hypothetical protein